METTNLSDLGVRRADKFLFSIWPIVLIPRPAWNKARLLYAEII